MVPPVIHTLRFRVRATAGYRSITRCFSLLSFTSLCYCTCSNPCTRDNTAALPFATNSNFQLLNIPIARNRTISSINQPNYMFAAHLHFERTASAPFGFRHVRQALLLGVRALVDVHRRRPSDGGIGRSQHRRLLGPERQRGHARGDMRHRPLRVRQPRLPLHVRRRPRPGPQPGRPLRRPVGDLRVPRRRHRVLPGRRSQGAPQHRRRRAWVQPVVALRRAGPGRVPLGQLPRRRRHRRVPPARRRRARRRRFRHRVPLQVLRRPRQEPGVAVHKGAAAAARGQDVPAHRRAAVPVPGRVPRRGARHGAVRPRVGAVLQQPAVPVRRARGRERAAERVGAVDGRLAGGDRVPGAAGVAGCRGQRVRRRGHARVAGAAGGGRRGQLRRDHAVEPLLRQGLQLQCEAAGRLAEQEQANWSRRILTYQEENM
ncbi:unknown protein [Oryza sativa Japonica Group]|uniref:Uncharacterized protein P0034C09.11 n=1 Tax=Oryza sativa subsp. japonica TaxID=39947 RepID=Q5N7S3_ORYSJ|nr:unknown protein [Oryza sativa Japonica Group]